MMEHQPETHLPPRRATRAERLLAATGIDSTPVARCPVAECQVCAPRELHVAA